MKNINMKEIDNKIKNLHNDCVETKPLDMDWRERLGEDFEGWRSYETVECYGCGEDIVVQGPCGEVQHCDIDESECEEWLSGEGPAMNYAYPLGHITHSADDAKDLPGSLCLVEMDDKWFLALTGGGMDLSWDICRAYIALGYLPPVHFELPEFAGDVWNEDKALIVTAMKRSLDLAQRWNENRAERLNEVADHLKKAQ